MTAVIVDRVVIELEGRVPPGLAASIEAQCREVLPVLFPAPALSACRDVPFLSVDLGIVRAADLAHRLREALEDAVSAALRGQTSLPPEEADWERPDPSDPLPPSPASRHGADPASDGQPHGQGRVPPAARHVPAPNAPRPMTLAALRAEAERLDPSAAPLALALRHGFARWHRRSPLVATDEATFAGALDAATLGALEDAEPDLRRAIAGRLAVLLGLPGHAFDARLLQRAAPSPAALRSQPRPAPIPAPIPAAVATALRQGRPLPPGGLGVLLGAEAEPSTASLHIKNNSLRADSHAFGHPDPRDHRSDAHRAKEGLAPTARPGADDGTADLQHRFDRHPGRAPAIDRATLRRAAALPSELLRLADALGPEEVTEALRALGAPGAGRLARALIAAATDRAERCALKAGLLEAAALPSACRAPMGAHRPGTDVTRILCAAVRRLARETGETPAEVALRLAARAEPPRLRRLLAGLATDLAHPAVTPPPAARPAAADLPAVPGAGLVLLWPFLPTAFARLGVIEDGTLRDEAARAVARHFLERLVAEEAAETAPLEIARLLTGAAGGPHPPVTLDLDTVCDVASALLEALRRAWPVLSHTSDATIKESFLRRAGRIRRRDEERWIDVAPAPYDILLDTLPWPLSPIRLPWMASPLRVTWR